MSSKDMFRKEQRFSFRKFSFGLASAVIANVIFGGAIASSPIVHANTAEPTSTVAPSERLASVSYTVNVVDQAGTVINTQTKNVSVQTTEATAVATANLTTDLVPEGYALVSGLGQETVTENAENVFTVVVEKAVAEVASTETSTSATAAASETSTAVATSEVAESTKVATSEVVNTAAVAAAAAETVPNKTERTAYLSYITHYVNEANETVDRRGHLVAVTTTDDTAKTQVRVSASENMPSGYELAQDKAEVVLQLVENQTNVLVFSVTKKSKEEEVAESQLSNRDVLMRLSLEADLLADEALRQVAKEQAGNTALETAANDTKAAATAANQVLANAAATEVELDDQIDTVRTSTQNLAAEMLKVDKDGILTAMLDATQVSRPANYQEIGTEAGAFHPDKSTLTRYLFVFGTTEGTTESNANGTLNADPVANKAAATRSLVPAGTITSLVYNDGKTNTNTLGSNLKMDTDGFLEGTFNHTAGGPYTRKLIVTTDTGTQTSNEFTVYAYTDKASSDPVEKLEDQALTRDEVFAKMAIATTSTRFQNAGKNIPTVPADEYTRSIVGYRTVTVGEDGSEVKGAFVEQTDLAQFPKDKDLEVKVQTTNVYGQTIYNWVKVDYNLKPKVELVDAVEGERKTIYVFSKNSGTTEDSNGAIGTNVAFDKNKATKAVVNITDDGQVTRIVYNDARNDTADMLEKGVTPATLVGTDGYFEGSVAAPAGTNATRLLKVTDDKGLVGQSPTFRVYAFSDTVPANVTPVRLAKGTSPALEEITAKMVIDSNSGYPRNAKVAIPEDAYTRTVVGYRLDGSTDTVAVDSVAGLPTEGSYKVRVKTSNAYGQEIYNWVPVSHYKLEEVSRETVNKYTDFPAPIHAITELGSSGTVGTVKLEGDLPEDFNIANFNLKEGEAAKLAERNLEFVKADAIGQDGTVGTIRPKDGGKVEYTGSGNLDYVFEYNYQVNNENKTSNLTYTILYTDTQAPVMTPKSEYIRFVNEKYDISVPGTDNAFLSTEKINGTLSVLKDGESGRLVSSDLGTNTAITSELDPKGVDVSGGVDNQGGNSTKFNVNITGTGPSEQGTGDYKLRVGENNYPAGPNVERVDGKKPENVGLTPIKVTFVKRAEVTTPVAVVDPANLTADEKAAVIKQLKEDNADNQRLQDLPDTAFTVNADGTVSVDYSKGDTNIDGVTDTVKNATVKLADAQKEAKDAIDAKLAEEKAAIEAKRDADIAEINNTPGLTDDQKKAARDAVTDTAGKALTDLQTKADDAKKAIDAETTVAGIDDAKTAGEKALDDAKAAGESAIDLTKDKELAKADVDNQAKAAIEAVKNNPNLDESEQAPYIEAIEKAAEKQKAAIDKAKDTAGITDAVNEAEKVNEEQKLAAAKEDAKDKIAEEAAAAKDAIDKDPNLSDAEKTAAKNAVDTEVAKANGEIDKATTPDAAQAAEEAGTKAIAADVLDAAKLDAKNKIAKDLATVEAAIDANSNLTPEEKEAAKLAAQAKATEAVANIEKATTPEAVQTLEDAAVKDLANIEIKAAYDDAVKAIEAADNLSTAAKTQALDDLKKARQAAEEAVKNATTADEVAKGALDGLKSIATVEATAAADDAKEAIAKNSNLTADEKKVYTDAIDATLKATEAKIKDATDADTVDAETVLAQKEIAKQEVAAATADAVEGIEANANLTPEEKAEYKATVTKAAETAEKAIADATTAADIQSKTFDATQDVAKEEVKADAADAIAGIKANDNLSDTAKEEAIAAIEEARDTTLENIENAKTAAEVDTATLDAEKANAKAEIKAAADDAKKAIDENANLPASDKNALKLAIDAEVAATNLEIDNAKTAEEIDAATLATEKSIAKAEVKAAAEDALQAIDENANLTDDEKAAAKADVYVELSKAEKAIDKATTADAIDNATLVGEKAFATAELEAAADDAKKAIDANTHLTDDQKQAAKDAVDAELAKAKEAVAGAVTADEVDAATLVGEKAVAKEEIKAAAEDAKKAIDANSNLTDDEKAAAKAAVDTEVA
ncbi:TPA: DUF1542 domain-containing protein, partial [Streptococcus suis]